MGQLQSTVSHPQPQPGPDPDPDPDAVEAEPPRVPDVIALPLEHPFAPIIFNIGPRTPSPPSSSHNGNIYTHFAFHVNPTIPALELAALEADVAATNTNTNTNNDEGKEFKIARRLLKYGADPNGVVTTTPLATPLGAAAYCGHWQLVDLLIEHGADPDRTSTHGSRPIHDCIKGLSHSLLNRVSSSSSSSNNACAHAPAVACLARLLNASADPNTGVDSDTGSDHYGFTALHDACALPTLEARHTFVEM